MYVGAFVNLRKPLFDTVNTWWCVMIRASCIIDEPSVKAVDLSEGWFFFVFVFLRGKLFLLTDLNAREGKEKVNCSAALSSNTISCQPGFPQININDCVYMDLSYPRFMIRFFKDPFLSVHAHITFQFQKRGYVLIPVLRNPGFGTWRKKIEYCSIYRLYPGYWPAAASSQVKYQQKKTKTRQQQQEHLTSLETVKQSFVFQ